MSSVFKDASFDISHDNILYNQETKLGGFFFFFFLMAAIDKTSEHITKLQTTYVDSDTLILIIRQHFRTISTLFLEYAKLRKSAKIRTKNPHHLHK